MSNVLFRKLTRRHLSTRTSALRLFGVFRNENLRLPYFFRYYRDLGVNEFVIADNGSVDGTLEWLLEQPDAHVFAARGSYLQSNCGSQWLEYFLKEFGCGAWCVVADGDELFKFPHCESRSLRQLTYFLESRGESAVFALLLDMYPNSTFDDIRYERGMDPLRLCQYFDDDSHFLWKTSDFHSDESRVGEFPHFYQGGMRHRVLGVTPCLNKIPLLKYDRGVKLFIGAHFVEGVKISRLRGVVLHFKFLQDFSHRVREEAKREEHYKRGAQYKDYARALSQNRLVNPYYSRSQRFRNSHQLMNLGLMRSPAEWGGKGRAVR